jgi:hypothetical protein
MNSRAWSTLAALLLPALPAAAQDAPFHAKLRDSLQVAGASQADVWGQGSVAIVGRFGQPFFDTVDVSDPDAIALLATTSVPAPNESTSAQDVKMGWSAVGETPLAFVSFDFRGPDGIGIYDMTDPASPVLLTRVLASRGTDRFNHNATYRDDGWLVTCDSVTASLSIYDLRTFDPAAPPERITSWTYRLDDLGTGFVHDVTITDDYLFVSQWDSLIVYDVASLGARAPVYLGEVGGFANHAVWCSDDGQYVVTSDERTRGALRLYALEVQDGKARLDQLDSWVGPAFGDGATFSVHNPVMVGDRVYSSNYAAGAIVLQIDRSTGTWERVASYDTSVMPTFWFFGAWGVYPLLGEDRVLVSDIEAGLFVVDFSALQLRTAAGSVTTLDPRGDRAVSVEIDELGNAALDPDTVTLHARVEGGPWRSTPMAAAGDGWSASLPELRHGERVDYYLAATSRAGETFTAPAVAPQETFSAYGSIGLVPVYTDDLRIGGTNGWTVDNDASLTSGGWELGAPQDTGMQPGRDDPRDADGVCFVTENARENASLGLADVDGGPTRLVSPRLDFSKGDGLISYSLWQASSGAENADQLLVSVSNDDGASWSHVGGLAFKSGGWLPRTFRVSDHVAPSATVRVRFNIKDGGGASITEGGVDNFRAFAFQAEPVAAAVPRNGRGVNASCFRTDAPVLGSTWTATVEHGHHPGATFTVVAFSSSPASGPVIAGGEMLLDARRLQPSKSVVASAGTADEHRLTLPDDVALLGARIHAQAAILGGPTGLELCNAFELTAGRAPAPVATSGPARARPLGTSLRR